MEKFYVTTPIYYVNAAPHIGSLYTTLAADSIARYYRLKLGSENVLFLTGTDEHGQKIAESAEKSGMDPKSFADSVVPLFKDAWKSANISYDYFIRTTDEGHKKYVKEVFEKIYAAGHIYKGLYEGMYCVGCEKFITETEMVNARCPLHPDKDLIHQKEENYFFRLKEFAPRLLELIKNGEYDIQPASRKSEIISRLEQGVEDISISRETVSWGIPIPWDEKHSFYVWVEALCNYYTATRSIEGKEDFWPPQLQLVGKDIVWFHTVIWQALLLAAELSLPKTIFAHGFFTIDGQKMSKSLGNVITPAQIIERYSVDGARYVLMSANQFGNDGDISLAKFDEAYNADLAHGLGNLVSRVAKLAEGETGLERPHSFTPSYVQLVETYLLDQALDDIWKRIKEADAYLNKHEPWKIKDNPEKRTEIVVSAAKDVAQIAYDIQPFMPDTAEKILQQFCGKTIVVEKPYFMKIT